MKDKDKKEVKAARFLASLVFHSPTAVFGGDHCVGDGQHLTRDSPRPTWYSEVKFGL